MNQKDQLKVINAGFTIIRKEGQTGFSELRIKHKDKWKREWATLEKGFKSAAEMERRMKELLKLSTVIED